eukprot:m.65630 g.65630  ORF g.65630 m.65630 type:complete len:435 (+) comp13550_c0_seq1:308-1612(+)
MAPSTVEQGQRQKGLALLLLLALLPCIVEVSGMPCPGNAVFVHSSDDQEDYCACAPGLLCIGSECTHGSQNNPNSFRPQMAGFPWRCIDCRCVDGLTGDRNASGEPRVLHLTSELAYPDYPDRHFDDICVITGPSAHLPRALPNITWLHFPKCGTSFETILYSAVCQSTDNSVRLRNPSQEVKDVYTATTCRYCYDPCFHSMNECFISEMPADGLIRPGRAFVTKMCTSKYVGAAKGHTPLRDAVLELNTNLVAMFRNPLTRLKSAYNHARHAYGLVGRNDLANMSRDWPLKKWAEWPGIAHCQTKMLLGQHCGSSFVPTRDDFNEALRRVDEHFAFVGLVEAWNTSVCLFHRMFGGRIDEMELFNTRPGTHIVERFSETYRMATDDDLHELTIENDPWDYELYQYVRKKFISLLEEYGLEVPDHIRHPKDIYH